MARGKLFIGRKVRELREAGNATQAVFAAQLGISTSYLNQIENNQRPVSAAVLLSLAEKFQIDLASLGGSDTHQLLSALSEALADPVFGGFSPSLQDLKLVAQNAPAFAHALIAGHQAYRRNREQLASFDDQLTRNNTLTEPTPYEEVRDFFQFMNNYIHELDMAAEELGEALGLPDRDVGFALADYLESKHQVRVAAAAREERVVRRFDAFARVLYLSPYSARSTRNFQLAFQIGALENAAGIDAIIRRANFRTDEAKEICRIGLQNYFAGALVLPYRRFLELARKLRHDLHLLATRFDASLEQVAHRLSTMQKPGSRGVPVFFARVDKAGNITKRHSAVKFQFARYGAACPLWNVYQAFEAPGRMICQLAETPDGVRYMSIATEIAKADGGFATPQRRYAIALGCEISYVGDFVYGDRLDVSSPSSFEPIGVSCRICERKDCIQRAVPPLKGKIAIDHNWRGELPYTIC